MCFSLEVIQVEIGFKNSFVFGYVIFLRVFSQKKNCDLRFYSTQGCFRVFCVLLQVMFMRIVLSEFQLILCFMHGFLWFIAMVDVCGQW